MGCAKTLEQEVFLWYGCEQVVGLPRKHRKVGRTCKKEKIQSSIFDDDEK